MKCKIFHKIMMRFAIINNRKMAFNLQYINSNARVVYVEYNYYNLCPHLSLKDIICLYIIFYTLFR